MCGYFKINFITQPALYQGKLKIPIIKKREFDVTEKYSDNYEIKHVIPSEVKNLQKILRRCRSSE